MEYNLGRKIWHASGSVFMVILYWTWLGSWQIFGLTVNGLSILTAIAWTITLAVIGIDLFRLTYPKQAEAIKKLPLFGSWLRKHEEISFNSATYFLFGASLCVTARLLGLGSDRLITAAVLTAGLADPAASTIRYWLYNHSRLNSELCGQVVFAIIGWLLLVLLGGIDWYWSLIIAMVTAIVESHMPAWFVQWKILFISRKLRLPYQPKGIWSRLYPDDNLLIPILVFGLGAILSSH